MVVHFSGALEVPGIFSAHPLMSFGPTFYTRHEYESIHYVLCDQVELKSLLPKAPNNFSFINKEQKSKYHSLCVLGGNFTTILIKKMLTEFSQLNIPASAAQVYIEKILSNVFSRPEAALTGPLQRRDFLTIDKNRLALSRDPFAKVYDSFVQAECPEYFFTNSNYTNSNYTNSSYTDLNNLKETP